MANVHMPLGLLPTFSSKSTCTKCKHVVRKLTRRDYYLGIYKDTWTWDFGVCHECGHNYSVVKSRPNVILHGIDRAQTSLSDARILIEFSDNTRDWCAAVEFMRRCILHLESVEQMLDTPDDMLYGMSVVRYGRA